MKVRLVGLLLIYSISLFPYETHAQNCSIKIKSEVKTACFGSTDGRINIDVVGAQEPYTIQWENGSSEPYLANLKEGSYKVSITDANGCSISKKIKVPESDEIDVEWEQINRGNQKNSINILKDNGRGPLTFYWYDLEKGTLYDSKSLNDVESKKFSLVIKDDNGCIKTFSVDLN